MMLQPADSVRLLAYCEATGVCPITPTTRAVHLQLVAVPSLLHTCVLVAHRATVASLWHERMQKLSSPQAAISASCAPSQRDEAFQLHSGTYIHSLLAQSPAHALRNSASFFFAVNNQSYEIQVRPSEQALLY